MFRNILYASLLGICMAVPAAAQQTDTAIFAGGCFWCVESDFDKVPGVVSTVSGYSGGTLENPTYPNHEGHREVVRIEYDPARVDFKTLVDVFFRTVDPTDGGGQFCDRGHAYTTAIYFEGEEQRSAAERAKEKAQAELGQEIVTPIEPAGPFWPAEEYHQDYYEKNPVRYRYYRFACGRNERVQELWGDAAYLGVPSH